MSTMSSGAGKSSGGSSKADGQWKLKFKRKGEAAAEQDEPAAKAQDVKAKQDELKKAIGQKSIESFLNLLLKMCLSNTQQLRQVTGAIFRTWIIDGEVMSMQEVAEVGRQIPALQKEAKDNGTTIAPAHVQKWLAWLEFLQEEQVLQEEIELKASLQEYQQKLEAMEVAEVLQQVPYFLTKEAYKGPRQKKTLYRISYYLSPRASFTKYAEGDLELVLDRVLLLLGAERKAGAPPPETLERVAQDTLKEFWAKQEKKK